MLDKAIAKLAVQLEQNDLTEQQLSAELTEEYRLALQDYVIPDDISQDETVVEDDAGWQDLRDDENFSTELAIDTMVFNNNPSEDAVENKESIAEMPTMELPAFNKENYTLTQVEAELEYDGVSQPTDEQRAALYQPTDEKRAALYDEPYK